MYRLVLYLLISYLAVATVLSAVGQLPFSPISLVLSTLFLFGVCWAANALFAWAFGAPSNIESTAITALILALIFQPAASLGDLQYLFWAGMLAAGSKYILAFRNKHLFNPAAIAAVLTSFVLSYSASWWVGTTSMLPVVALGGLLIVRKLELGRAVAAFLAASLVIVWAVSALQNIPLTRELQQLYLESPVFFAGSIMLTEPQTLPPTRELRFIYGALAGALMVPQIHIGSLYSTPELALVCGNIFSYLVSAKQRVVLQLKRKSRVAPEIMDFVYTPSLPVRYAPGQYIEATLAHAQSDSRGNRRYFTLASSPTEDTIRLGVRFYPKGSSFKRALAASDGRTKLVAGQVAGDFTLPADPTKKLVFVAGGIGITPYRSMLKYLLDTRQRRDIVLLYANRTPQEFIYGDVLGEAQTRLGMKAVYTVTDTNAVPANWTGARGRIDEQMIGSAVPDYRERTFYLSGPPNMVEEHERALRRMGVPRSHIKRDFFPGLV